jgi:hypothetical protein
MICAPLRISLGDSRALGWPRRASFTDGDVVGACLDRNGLRPFRFQISDDDVLLVGSEVGTIDIGGAKIIEKGRLGPGQILALDLRIGHLMHNEEVKDRYAKAQLYRDWVNSNLIRGELISGQSAEIVFDAPTPLFGEELLEQQKAFGFTTEDVDDTISPMVKAGVEPTGSMGDDTPLAVLSEKPRLLPNYFRQRFAQVTNPPIDPLREKLVMSLHSFVGPLANLWKKTAPKTAAASNFRHRFAQRAMAALRNGETNWGGHFQATIRSTFDISQGEDGLQPAIKRLQADAAREVANGASILIISDRACQGSRAYPCGVGGWRCASSSHPRGTSHQMQPHRRIGRTARLAPFRVLDWLRRRRRQPYLALETAQNRTTGIGRQSCW